VTTNLIETMARAIAESVALFDCGECLTRGGDPHAWDCKQSRRDLARAAFSAIEAAGYRVVPVEPEQKRWHVVCEWDELVEDDGTPYEWRGERPHDNDRVWTMSQHPRQTGWETDSGCDGYGLTYAEAEELARAANSLAASPKVSDG
jgi:hypothetical protein